MQKWRHHTKYGDDGTEHFFVQIDSPRQELQSGKRQKEFRVEKIEKVAILDGKIQILRKICYFYIKHGLRHPTHVLIATWLLEYFYTSGKPFDYRWG